jgi:hypothetical protein
MKEWYQTKELIGLSGLPTTTQGVNAKAKNEKWKKRKAAGVRGRAYEYHITSLPCVTRNNLNPPSLIELNLTPIIIKQRLLQLATHTNDALIKQLCQQIQQQGIESLCNKPLTP